MYSYLRDVLSSRLQGEVQKQDWSPYGDLRLKKSKTIRELMHKLQISIYFYIFGASKETALF